VQSINTEAYTYGLDAATAASMFRLWMTTASANISFQYLISFSTEI